MLAVKQFLIGTLVALGVLSTFTLAHAGPGSSGGGDLRAIQFKKIGEALVDFLQQPNLPSELSELSTKSFRRAVKKAHVESTREVLTFASDDAGRTVLKDGINDTRSNSIVFNRDEFDHAADGSHRAALVAHEYARLAGIDDHDYQLSKWIFDLPQASSYFNLLPESARLNDEIEFDFMIKCVIDYKGEHIDRMEPIGTGFNGASGMVSMVGRILERKATQGSNALNGEVLKFMIYNPNDPNLQLAHPGLRRSNAGNVIHVTLGWSRIWDLPTAENILIDQEVKLVPNFSLNMALPEHQFKMDCHRITDEQFRHDPFFSPRN